MSIGTAGITAAASVIKIMDSKPSSELPIMVTGATGGVGSVAVMILSKLGFNVSALTGKPEAKNFLTQLGATTIILREDYLNEPSKPMVRPLFAGAVDTVGGSILSKLLSEIAQHGVVSCCGNVGGIEINTTVFPFILRGINLCGIDSAETPIEFKESLWKKFANEWQLDLSGSTKEVSKEQLGEEIQIILQGGQQGRVVLNHKE
jgi:putative YhdH/YhfP family quinone oxidoreductase